MFLACLVVASLLVLAPGASIASARAPLPDKKGEIRVGGSLFWDGGFVAGSTIGTNVPYGFANALVPPFIPVPAEACVGTGVDRCWTYSFDVGGDTSATTLRVAIDANRRGDCFQLEAWAPGTYDDPVARPTRTVLQCPELVEKKLQQQSWNMEAHLFEAVTGTWTLRVVPFFVTDWGFRLRVSLQPQAAATNELVPPNLQAYPPYEFGFVAPESPDAGTNIDKQNPPGPAGISCTQSELKEAASPPQRCLRLSAGMYNIGRGPLDLLLKPKTEAEGQQVKQHVHRDTTGGINEDRAAGEERAAGEWTFHADHDHSHYAGFVDFELYRVSQVNGPRLDPKSTKRLDPPVSGHKSGWHLADQRMAYWNRIDQAPADEILHHCRREDEKCISQGRGWGDHYRWQRPGNYVEFPINSDGSNVGGDYVVRMVVDRDDRVLESSERDNSAYAWIRVSGEDVVICERGLGESPWDPHKRVHAPSFWLTTPDFPPIGTTADNATEGCVTE